MMTLRQKLMTAVWVLVVGLTVALVILCGGLELLFDRLLWAAS
jgi:hypothetical protein